jgi:hypothetical protein
MSLVTLEVSLACSRAPGAFRFPARRSQIRRGGAALAFGLPCADTEATPVFARRSSSRRAKKNPSRISMKVSPRFGPLSSATPVRGCWNWRLTPTGWVLALVRRRAHRCPPRPRHGAVRPPAGVRKARLHRRRAVSLPLSCRRSPPRARTDVTLHSPFLAKVCTTTPQESNWQRN